VAEGRVLAANKIQFVLAVAPDPDALAGMVLALVDSRRGAHALASREQLIAEFGVANRYDSAAVTLVKRLLQRGLPEGVRRPILDELFGRLVTRDEAAFAAELYASPDQLRCMRRAGMFLGSHGYGHDWLDSLPEDERREDLEKGLGFLRGLGVDTRAWVLAYPYGGHDAAVMATAQSLGCRLAFTVAVGIADLDRNEPMAVPRLDTNDFPTAAGASPSAWLDRHDALASGQAAPGRTPQR
jgi:peptidoglycan/xylan/chitin deacetylase (PgdA/CDA1 family)